MKLSRMFAAASLVIASLGVSVAADAQQGRDHRPGVSRHDNGRHNVRNNRKRHHVNNRRRCHTEWRHHRRIRVCR